MAGVDRVANGIPTEAEYVAAYCQRMGLEAIPDWTFLIAFSFFRSLAIHQGVYKRSLDGNASNPELARQVGESVPFVAHIAMGGGRSCGLSLGLHPRHLRQSVSSPCRQ